MGTQNLLVLIFDSPQFDTIRNPLGGTYVLKLVFSPLYG